VRVSGAALRKFAGDEVRFLRSLLARPGKVGAIAPSSPALARAIAAAADPARPGLLLELGPGTGVVTRALIRHGFAEERIVAIEYDPDLAALVGKRFPRVRVIRGDAFDLQRTLGPVSGELFAAIVSGLPLLNRPLAQRRALIDAALDLLAPGAPFIQFSYGLWPPVRANDRMHVRHAARVLANLPPANVWAYESAARGST